MELSMRYRTIALVVLPLAFVLAGSADVRGDVDTRFELLGTGAVRPSGWIKVQMERDQEGFTGHLDELTARSASDVFAAGRVTSFEKTPAGKIIDTPRTWWNGETEAVWMDGLVRMAYLTGNQKAIVKVDTYIRHILNTQDQDGYLGIYTPESRYRHPKENGELWTQSRIVLVLLAYYELTGQHEVLEAVVRAVQLTMSQYGPGRTYFCNPEPAGGTGHGLMFVDAMEWLYRLTGDRDYVEFGRFCYEDYCLSEKIRDVDNQIKNLLDMSKPFLWHTPHTMEHLRVPLWLYFVTGKPELKRGYENAFAKTRHYLVPSGVCIGDELIRGRQPSPDLPYEYCAITELLVSSTSALQKTGEASYAQMAERVTFNAAQGARLPDGKAISYLTKDNRYQATFVEHGGRLGYSPTHERVAVCCNPNAGKLMPYYVDRMWMRANNPAGGLAALLYGPAIVTTQINNVKVHIKETTDYPFGETVQFTIQPATPVAFTLMLRNPGWSQETMVTVEGAKVRRDGDYHIVEKTWRKGDEVTVCFEARIEPCKAANGEVALQRGPLLYALPIPYEKKTYATYDLEGFADYEMLPVNEKPPVDHDSRQDSDEVGQWDYKLEALQGRDNNGFVAQRVKNVDITRPWDRSPIRLEGTLTRGRVHERVSLVPIGCTVLRKTTFEITEENLAQP